ncbi:hypothetical protein ACG7TL_009257 [Trametes sanguinea]
MVFLTTESPPGDPSLEKTFGALLIGTFFALMLYGLLVHQSSHYFRRFAKDTSINKAFEARRLTIWSLQLYPLITGLCVCVSQCFYARRVYLISVKYRILVTLAPLSNIIASWYNVVFTIAATVIACLTKQLERFVPDIWIDTASYASTVVSDAITTGVLVYNLKGYRTGIERTDAFLDRLASYAINTGLLIGLVAFPLMPQSAPHADMLAQYHEYPPPHPFSIWEEDPGRVPGNRHSFHQTVCELGSGCLELPDPLGRN